MALQVGGAPHVRAGGTGLSDGAVPMRGRGGILVDVAFLRVHEGGKPAATPRFFPWSAAGAAEGELVFQAGVVPDFRAPNVVRLAPTALYTSFEDVWKTVRTLREIMEDKRYEKFGNERGVVA